MGTFSESGAQAFRDSQLASHLNGLDDADSEAGPIDELIADLRLDTGRVSELLWNADSASWAFDAIAHAMATGDWLYLQHQAEKHVLPLLKQAAEADAAAEQKTSREIAGEARYESLQDARDFA